MARYINDEWVMDVPDPRGPHYNVGDVINVHGKDVVITKVVACHSVSGPIGCLLKKDEHLPDSYFKFIGYHCYFDRPIGHQKINNIADYAYKQDMEGNGSGYNRFAYPLPFTDEIPTDWKAYRKKRKQKVDLDWEYDGESEAQPNHHALYIIKPRKFNVTRKEFHSFSFYGIASFLINYPVSFEEFKGGIKIYLTETKLHEHANHPRFDGLEKRIFSSVEFGFIKVPRNHKLFPIIKEKFSHYFLI